MPDALQRAATGRSKCRGCERNIAKGELRFGEALPNPYAEGEAMHWFHLACAACMRPEKFLPVLGGAAEEVAERGFLETCAERGVAHPRLARLARAERSPSARARCRHCSNPIDKGVWRFSLQVFEDGRANPIGSIHASCAEAYFGTRDVLDHAQSSTPELGDEAVAELQQALSEPAPPPGDALAKTRPEPQAAAKTSADAAASGKRSAS